PLVAAAFFAILAVATSRYGPSRPRIDSVTYALDTDQHVARYVTRDRPIGRFAAQFVPQGSPRLALPEFTRSEQRLAVADAPPIAVAPRIAWQAASSPQPSAPRESQITPPRSVRLVAQSSSPPRCVRLWAESSARFRSIAIDGKPIVDLFRFS